MRHVQVIDTSYLKELTKTLTFAGSFKYEKKLLLDSISFLVRKMEFTTCCSGALYMKGSIPKHLQSSKNIYVSYHPLMPT